MPERGGEAALRCFEIKCQFSQASIPVHDQLSTEIESTAT